MRVSNKLYDTLKFIAQIALPAVGTLYVSLAALWDLPKPMEVSATILAVDTFLGILLGLQSNLYVRSGADLDGALRVSDSAERTQFQLSIDTPPEQLAQQDRVVLKVSNVQNLPTNQKPLI